MKTIDRAIKKARLVVFTLTPFTQSQGGGTEAVPARETLADGQQRAGDGQQRVC